MSTTASTFLSSTMTTTIKTVAVTSAPPSMYWRIKVVMDQVVYYQTAFDFTFVVVCLFNIVRHNNHCRSPYFIFLLLSTFIRGANYIIRWYKINYATLSPHWYNVTLEIWTGFSIQWHGIIIMAMAFNRATALGFPFKHQQYWRPRNFFLLCLFILVWPLVPNLFIAHLFYCYWWVDRDDGYCRANFIGTFKYIQASNLITPILALIINAVTILKKWSKLNLLTQKKQKIEVLLLYQSVYSSVTFFVWVGTTIFSYIVQQVKKELKNDPRLEFWTFIGNWGNHVSTFSAILYFEGGLILLFFMSKAARQSYFGFFGILFAYRQLKKTLTSAGFQLSNNSSTVVSISVRS